MPSAQPPDIRLVDVAPSAVDADVLLVPVFENDDVRKLGLPESAAALLAEARGRLEFKAKLYETFWVTLAASGNGPGRVLAIGAGATADYSSDRGRKLATAASLVARQRRLGRVAFLQRADTDIVHDAQAIAEGACLAAFDGDTYKTRERDAGPLVDVQIVVRSVTPELTAAVRRGQVLGTCSNMARELSNEPSNTLTPRVFADRAGEICAGTGLALDILDEKRIESLNMGLLLGVARGSAEPPRVIVMRHTPPDAVAGGPVLGLVGKGITFDTGGISIKPADGMERMKDDMAGGAGVIAAMRAIAMLGAPIPVIGIVPTTENMPGGRAMKPGDVLRSASGKTVEVINTDAEGRLILGDGLWYARELGATHLVDIATLTGACVVALGKITTGLFGTPQWWVDIVRETADRAGDRCWPLPLFEEYADQIRSEIADMMNTGGRPAGAITAAMFLKEFSGGLPWAHLDIAGTAWAEDNKPFQPKGAVGIAARSLAELAFTADRWR
jgi:leucyl aminopeptidase